MNGRYLPLVIFAILESVPPDYVRLRAELDNAYEHAIYSSPEMMIRWWKRTMDILIDHIPHPKAEWELKIQAIFNGTYVDPVEPNTHAIIPHGTT